MTYSAAEIWGIIALLGAGTFLIRFSFIGLFGGRAFPDWLLRHLRYTPVAVLPGLVAPLLIWPRAGFAEPEPVRLAVAAVALGVAYMTRNIIWGVIAAGVTFWGLKLVM